MKKTVNIVLPTYNESLNLPKLYSELKKVTKSLNRQYVFGIIFVNDGSTDDTLKKLIKLSQTDSSVTVLNLSRNFGHQIAITAGMDYSEADATITMDADLQDPPAVCQKLISKWSEGFDIVYAKRNPRKVDSIFKRSTAGLFYYLINKMSDTPIPSNVGDFRLIDKKVLDQIKKFSEHQRFIRGLISYAGFNQTTVYYSRASRPNGKTNYSLKKMWRLAVDGITGFSVAPLRFISKLGYSVSLLSVMGIVYVVGLKIFDPAKEVPGWAFVMVSMFFLGGVQLIMLGVLGSYISRIYVETQNRPLYIVSSITNKKTRRLSN
ncbi:MAG TPA: glycosyltransferase family 2 protein [Candidatus Saccharimonadales bacterium]|nr:glycosyltransferase family 2 protein [Candidatus Saccharimonadales bacterium]